MPRWCFTCVLLRAKEEPFAKLDRSSRGAAADGSSRVLNDSGFCTSFDGRIGDALPHLTWARKCLIEARDEVGLNVSHHARISQRGGEKIFSLTSFFIGSFFIG
jgi:hypothetical protein